MSNSLQWETVIGIEVHVQLATHSKAFCPSRIALNDASDTESNVFISHVSAGLPGSLPVFNRKALELATRAGLLLNCSIQSRSLFSRKHYFYPDLPKGYQTSQLSWPLCLNGWVDIKAASDSKTKRIRIQRIHLEEDAGKLTHSASGALVDLNRAGVPLIEIVSEPDISSAQEAVSYLKQIHQNLVFSEVTIGNLEAAHFRADLNISIKEKGSDKLGTRTEIKNINSFRFAEAALNYEIFRQIALLNDGKTITQETRGWDESSESTYSLRSKEDAPDYRYFPDPDLPPLYLSDADIEKIKCVSPRSADSIRQQLLNEQHLHEEEIERLLQNINVYRYWELSTKHGASAKEACNWVLSELLREVQNNAIIDSPPERWPLPPKGLADIIALLESSQISRKMAKKLFVKAWQSGIDPKEIVQSENLLMVTDSGTIRTWALDVIAKNPESISDYKNGKKQAFDHLLGQLMRLSQGKADPHLSQKILQELMLEN